MRISVLLAILLTAGLIGIYRFAYAASIPAIGTSAPEFNLPDAYGKLHNLKNFQGKWLVLYFYPKDDTPGCTKEACSFRDDLFALEKLGAQVVGISVDDGNSHANFAKKYHLPFPLLTDKDGKVAQQFGALTDLGLIKFAKRYTFLISPEGKISKIYTSVDTSKHSQEIIDDLEKLVNDLPK